MPKQLCTFLLIPILIGILLVLAFWTHSELFHLPSHANTANSLEPENGSITGPITVQSDTTASNGRFTQFNQPPIIYPANSGMVNIKSFGAKGDGVTDDTKAIQNAIYSRAATKTGLMVYFPEGTYLVSDTVYWKLADGTYYAYVSFLGAGEGRTIIKLKDNSPGFATASSPKAVLYTASMYTYGGTAPADGGGNEAYYNNIMNLKIDVGKGNAGAIGIEYIANNRGTIENVTIRSSDTTGKTGLSMQRYGPGPLLIKHLTVDGFDEGIHVAKNDYSVTGEYITLRNQKVVGIKNESNVLAFRKVMSTNTVPGVQNASGNGLIVLLDSVINGTPGSSTTYAIDNAAGEVLLRNITTSQYKTALRSKGVEKAGGTITEFVSTAPYTLFSTSSTSLNLPIKETPDTYYTSDLSQWADVTDPIFGATPDSPSTAINDDSIGIQKAIDSGKPIVYLPEGRYHIKNPLIIRGSVKALYGFESEIWAWYTPLFNDATSPAPIIRFIGGTEPTVTLDNFVLRIPYDTTVHDGTIGLEDSSDRTLVLKHMQVGGKTIDYRNTSSGTGDIFFEDSLIGRIRIDYPQHVWARQLNPEVNDTRILNNGGTLWVLGLKTEKPATIVETTNSGSSEILGALLYPVTTVPTADIAFKTIHAHTSVSYATTVYNTPANDYPIHIQETQETTTRQLLYQSILRRGLGSLVPLYRSQ